MNPRNILKENNFRVTSHRCDVLNYFIHAKNALSHADLEIVFKNKIDRVSLYRILHSFSEKHLLCKIIDSKGNITYIIDQQSSKNNTYQPHYKCKSCNDVVELPALPKEYLEYLEKLNIEELNFLAEGTCETCTNNK